MSFAALLSTKPWAGLLVFLRRPLKVMAGGLGTPPVVAVVLVKPLVVVPTLTTLLEPPTGWPATVPICVVVVGLQVFWLMQSITWPAPSAAEVCDTVMLLTTEPWTGTGAWIGEA